MENTNEEGIVDLINEGESEPSNSDVVTLSRADYEKLNQTLGSLKRELKDFKKPKEESQKETPKTNSNPEENNPLIAKLERLSLKTAGITHPDDVEFAKETAKKWGMDIDELIIDEDFQVKLAKNQNARENVQATSGVRGQAGSSQAKFTPEYWIAKGTPPSANDVPDRKTRAKIARTMMASAKSSKTFYND